MLLHQRHYALVLRLDRRDRLNISLRCRRVLVPSISLNGRGLPIVVGGLTPAPLAGPSWQSAQVGVGGLSGLDADAAVDGLDAVGADDDGAQFELGDLRQ